MPLHCFHCASLTSAANWSLVDADPSEGGAPVQRWCSACNQARQRGGLWGPNSGGEQGDSDSGSDSDSDDGGEEHVRPAVATGACCPPGCSGCTLPALPANAQRVRKGYENKGKAKGKRRVRKNNSWGKVKKGKT